MTVICSEKEQLVTCDEECGKLLACGKHVVITGECHL